LVVIFRADPIIGYDEDCMINVPFAVPAGITSWFPPPGLKLFTEPVGVMHPAVEYCWTPAFTEIVSEPSTFPP
jgi:hypothetical protein